MQPDEIGIPVRIAVEAARLLCILSKCMASLRGTPAGVASGAQQNYSILVRNLC